MEDEMRVVLLDLILAVVSLVGSLDAWAAFNCFDTPGRDVGVPASVRAIAAK